MQEKQQKRIVAFTGRKASGKGVAGAFFAQRYGAHTIDYSISLHEALAIMDIPEIQINITKLSMFLRSRFGADVLQKSVCKKILASQSSLVSLFGVRRVSDFESIKKEYRFQLIFIESQFDIRYQRYIARNQRTGDREMDKKYFQALDESEPELQIESLKPLADYVVENNKTMEEFQKALEEVFETII